MSVGFAAEAGDLELADKISGAMQKFRILAIVVAFIASLFIAAYYVKKTLYSMRDNHNGDDDKED